MANQIPGLSPESPLTRALAIGSREIKICGCEQLAFCAVSVRSRMIKPLESRVRERFGIELPRGPHRATANGTAFLGVRPGAWLATSEREGSVFFTRLASTLGELAAVSEQSDAYVVLYVTGAKAREALCKLVPIDLDESVFQLGDVAQTLAGEIGVTLWRLENHSDGSPVFEIAVPRSYATGLRQRVSESAAEFLQRGSFTTVTGT